MELEHLDRGLPVFMDRGRPQRFSERDHLVVAEAQGPYHLEDGRPDGRHRGAVVLKGTLEIGLLAGGTLGPRPGAQAGLDVHGQLGHTDQCGSGVAAVGRRGWGRHCRHFGSFSHEPQPPPQGECRDA